MPQRFAHQNAATKMRTMTLQQLKQLQQLKPPRPSLTSLNISMGNLDKYVHQKSNAPIVK